jgi:hypothetical protein
MRFSPYLTCILASGTIEVGPASIPWRMTRTREGTYHAVLADYSARLDGDDDRQALVVGVGKLSDLLRDFLDLRQEIDPFTGPLFEHSIAVQDTEEGRAALVAFFAALSATWEVVIEDELADAGVRVQSFTTFCYLPPLEARVCLPQDANTVSSVFITWDWNNAHLFWARDVEERRKRDLPPKAEEHP